MSNIATIFKKTSSTINFKVDDVEIAEELLSVTNAKSYLEQNHERELIVFSHSNDFEILAEAGNHPLATAVHLAFSQHRPLLLTPDIIWMAIAQGFAQHINNNAEKLRHKFVTHQDKVTLELKTLTPTNAEQWSQVISEWGLQIREHIDPKLYQLMLCDFTTTTDTIHTASQVVMMNAFKQYFDYRVVCICGIPNITLLGTVDDWKTIRDRVNVIAQYDIEWWTDRLLPICQGFIATAEGNPPLQFWQHIYKPKEVYGGDVITGWLADLFPYLKDPITHEPTRRNSILSISRNKITVNDGIRLQSLPVGLSETTFTLESEKQEQELELIGGFIDVTQDKDNKYLKPEIGWGIREKDNLSKLINSLSIKQANSSPDWSQLRSLLELPKDIIQLADNLSGVTLSFDTKYSWYIRKPGEYKPCKLTEYNQYFTSFIELQDNRYLAYGVIDRTYGKWYEDDYKTWEELWIVVGKTEIEQHEDDLFEQERLILISKSIKLVAKGIPQLLERIIAAEGKYYFDDPSSIPNESLDVLLKS